MKKKRKANFITIGILKVLLLASIMIVGCHSGVDEDFVRAQQEAQKGNYSLAFDFFDRVILKNPQSKLSVLTLKEAANVALTKAKDYSKAEKYLKQIIISSPEEQEMVESKKHLISIYFDHLNDYKKSIKEINQLIQVLPSGNEKFEYQMKLVRSYFHLNKIEQAKFETDDLINLYSHDKEKKFELLFFKSNVLLAQKEHGQAIAILQEIMKDFPQESKKQNVGLMLSVVYEEKNDYKNAIEILKKIRTDHPMPDYIDLRIKKLQIRAKNEMPQTTKIK